MIEPSLLILLLFGFWISYTDIKNGVIKNYSLLLLILVATLMNIFWTKAFVNFPLITFFNILFAIVAGLIIWLAGIWSVADAKLFVALNFLIPPTSYRSWSDYFPGFALLLNTALFLFLFLFFQVVTKTNLQEKKTALLSHLKFSFFLRLLLITLAIFNINFFIHYFLRIRIEYFLWLIFLFLVFWLVEENLKINLNYFFIFVLLFGLILAFILKLPLFTLTSLLSVFIATIFLFFFFVILTLATPLFTKSIKIDDLKEGMILAEMIVKEGEHFIKKPITFLNFLVLLRERRKWKPEFGFNPDGLEREEIEEIQSLAKKGLLGFEELKISLTIPLAPILFFAALVTYLSKGALLDLIL